LRAWRTLQPTPACGVAKLSRLWVLDGQEDTNDAGKKGNAFDKSGTDDHRRADITGIFRLAAAGFESGCGQTTDTRTDAEHSDAKAETG
jgi:hypothetical protein